MYWPIGNIALKPIVKIVAVLVLIAGIVAGVIYLRNSIYKNGYEKAELEGEVRLNDFKSQLRDQFSKQLQDQAAVESDLRNQAQRAQEEKENEIKLLNEHHARIVDGLRSRASRSDSRPSKDPSPAPSAPDSTGARCTGRELLREDGEFLAREAARAEILKRKLVECMKNYKALEEKLNK